MEENSMGSNIDVNIQPVFTSKKLGQVQNIRPQPLSQLKALHNVVLYLKVARTLNGLNFTILSCHHLKSCKCLLIQMICLVVFRPFLSNEIVDK